MLALPLSTHHPLTTMKKKPHHSTVFRKKALAEIDTLKSEATKLERRVVDLSHENSDFATKLSAQATQLVALKEARNNLLKEREESKKTVEVLTDALTTICHTTNPVGGDIEDPARQAVEAVRQLQEYSEKKDVESREAKDCLAEAEDEIAVLKGEIARINDRHAARLVAEEERYGKKWVEAIEAEDRADRHKAGFFSAIALCVFIAFVWIARELTRGSL